MALTQQVEDSLREAQLNLKNALAYSARNEESYISKHIADMMMKIDCLCEVSVLIDHVEDSMRVEDE